MKITKLFGLLAATIGLGLASCNQTPSASVENKFPVKEVIAFFDEAGLDVVIPAYESKANDFEVDTEDPEAFVIYANGSDHDEMAAYKDALIKDSWILANEVEGDYLLSYAETDAIVSLVDFGDYVGIAFSVYSVESHTAEEVANAFNEGISVYGLSASFYDIEDVFTGWYLGVSFGDSEDDSEANLSAAAATLAQFLPDYLIVFEEGYEAASETSDAEYYAILVTEGFDVAVEIYSYLDEGALIAEIYIYDLAE